MANTRPTPSAGAYALIGAIALVGLGLRIAGAQGGLWLDEAWSAVFARDARSPFDIFFVIRHDNNHYLNTLWLYLTGWGAPPMVSRLFAVATGTLAIIVGGLIGLRRGRIQGVLLALFLAISPMFVTYGAEARGYAPMFLAVTLMIWVTARWLDRQQGPAPSLLLAGITAFGMLSHLTMLFALAGIGLWAAAVLAKGRTVRALIAVLFDLFGLSAIVAIGVLAMGVVIPWLSPAGFAIGGGYFPFSLAALGKGLGELFEYGLGLRGIMIYAIALPLALLIPTFFNAVRRDRSFFLLCVASLFATPFLFILVLMGNAGFGRYQLLTCFGILLVASELVASGWQRAGWRRAAALIAIVALIFGQTTITLGIIANKRGDPMGAVRAMAARTHSDRIVAVGHNRDVAVMEAAIASAGYRATVTQDLCGRAEFLFLEAPYLADLPRRTTACDIRYIGIANGARADLSGMSWRLYVREDQAAARRSSAARSTS